MFYTRIILSPRHQALRNDQQNAYLQHRRIESLFPDHKRSDASVLFRWEQQTIFIQSAVEPRFDLLPKNYTNDVQTKLLNLDQLLKPNQWLEFRLLADTSGIEAETRRRKPRNAEQLPDWLASRLDSAAKLDKFVAIQHGPQIAVHRLEQRWKLKPTSFTGYLTVIDPKQLGDVITAGFGRSRAYGCGLMQVAPAKESV
ncbi:type I-E CRISPR-associated protein Cas6/Cse3/CasE [Leptolyngbya sp. FACHB-321]|uniref:type I-E CRISPR-associated protein Cas6/Cse3/CasE n=1 Tax=Leptolyngbya sp. FACHB-321 TaxID=2692807 RepID=UPI00168548A2|nr:type I-E CRISPR-associated protein Cas6/Cse3/CasE [Leptolyngbya sp. FACHB-321]MBD2037762.1 type I-E CRISPR-associated protein Cas6/Cse3/CasE [Leptolyngbya sp. FACHB-321]